MLGLGLGLGSVSGLWLGYPNTSHRCAWFKVRVSVGVSVGASVGASVSVSVSVRLGLGLGLRVHLVPIRCVAKLAVVGPAVVAVAHTIA